jgi:hypothetical protein
MRRLKLADFVALYRGRRVAEAELVAVSTESSLVRKFFAKLLGESEVQSEDPISERLVSVLEADRDE